MSRFAGFYDLTCRSSQSQLTAMTGVFPGRGLNDTANRFMPLADVHVGLGQQQIAINDSRTQ